MNVLISIGNSDDKLSQYEWSCFVDAVRTVLRRRAELGDLMIHGEWFSLPDSVWQNANWCVEPMGMTNPATLKRELVEIRERYRQDSIAWTQGPVEFI